LVNWYFDRGVGTVNATGDDTAIMSVSTGSFKAAFYDYTANDGTNMRIGKVICGWIGTNIIDTDTTTNDFGDTSALTMSANVNGGNVQLVGNSTAGTWTVNAVAKYV